VFLSNGTFGTIKVTINKENFGVPDVQLMFTT